MVNKQIVTLSEHQRTLNGLKDRCHKLLSTPQFSLDGGGLTRNDREENILSLFHNLFSNEEYAPYHYDRYSVIQIVKDSTQAMDIRFSNEINLEDMDAFVTMNCHQNSSIQCPCITLKQPIVTKTQRKGYKLKFKWIVNEDSGLDSDDGNKQRQHHPRISKRHLSFWWKKNDQNWTKCKKSNIDLKSKTVVFHQLLLFDNIYSFKIEYALKQPLKTSVPSTIQKYSMSREDDPYSMMSGMTGRDSNHSLASIGRSSRASFTSTKIRKHQSSQKLKLRYHSHRGNFEKHHPRHLLRSSCRHWYCSQRNADFERGEKDWIIFRFDGDYVPTEFYIKNGHRSSAVRVMKVCIGDIKSDQWMNTEDVIVENRKKIQRFDISGMTKGAKWKYIKVVLKENYGENLGDEPRFGIDEFGVYGIPSQYAFTDHFR